MTITLDLAPEDEAQLKGIALRQGQNADKVAYFLFTAALAQATSERWPNGILPSRPVTEWDAEFRAKYNIPQALEPLSEEELNSLP